MHCFYIEKEQICGDCIEVIGEDVNHIKNVLRRTVGDEITLCDGNGFFYKCSICELSNQGIKTKILEQKEATTELPGRVYLFQGLPKKDKMELIIQKAVELGVYEVIPVSTKFCVAKIEDDKKEKKKKERWQTISMTAAKQSGRGMIPSIHSLISFKEAIAIMKELDVGLMPYENAKGMIESKKQVEEAAKQKSIGIIIGPEGGFSEEEVAFAREAGIKPVTLGSRILRTETAGFTMLSLLMFEMEAIGEDTKESNMEAIGDDIEGFN